MEGAGLPLKVVKAFTHPRLWSFSFKTASEEIQFRFDETSQGPPQFWNGGKKTLVYERIREKGYWVYKDNDVGKLKYEKEQPRECGLGVQYKIWDPPPTSHDWASFVPGNPDENVTIEYCPQRPLNENVDISRHLHVAVDADVADFAREFRTACDTLNEMLDGDGLENITYSISSTSPIIQHPHMQHTVIPCLLWVRSGAVTSDADLNWEVQRKFIGVAVVCHAKDADRLAENLCKKGNAQCAVAIGPMHQGYPEHFTLENQLGGSVSALAELFKYGPRKYCPLELQEYFKTDIRLRQSNLRVQSIFAARFEGDSDRCSRKSDVLFVSERQHSRRSFTKFLAEGSFCRELLVCPFLPRAQDEHSRSVAADMASKLVQTIGGFLRPPDVNLFVIQVMDDSRGIGTDHAKAIAHAVCTHAMFARGVKVVSFCEVRNNECHIDQRDVQASDKRAGGTVFWLNGAESGHVRDIATSGSATSSNVITAIDYFKSKKWRNPNTAIVTAMLSTEWDKFAKSQTLDSTLCHVYPDCPQNAVRGGLAEGTDNPATQRECECAQRECECVDGGASAASPPTSTPGSQSQLAVLATHIVQKVYCGRNLRPCLNLPSLDDMKEKQSRRDSEGVEHKYEDTQHGTMLNHSFANVHDIHADFSYVINTPSEAHTSLDRLLAFKLAHCGLDLRPHPSIPDRFFIPRTGDSALGLCRLHETIAQALEPLASTQTGKSLVVRVQHGSIVVPSREIVALQKLTIVLSTVAHTNISVVTGRPGLGEQEYVPMTDTKNHKDKDTFFVCRTAWGSQVFFKETDSKTDQSRWYFSGFVGGFHKMLTTSNADNSSLPPERGKWLRCDQSHEHQSWIDFPIRHVMKVVPSRWSNCDASTNIDLLFLTDDLEALNDSIKGTTFPARFQTPMEYRTQTTHDPDHISVPCLVVIETGDTNQCAKTSNSIIDVDIAVLCAPSATVGKWTEKAEQMCRQERAKCVVVLEYLDTDIVRLGPALWTGVYVVKVLTFVQNLLQLARMVDSQTPVLVGHIAAHVDGMGVFSVQIFAPGDSQRYMVPFDILGSFRASAKKDVALFARVIDCSTGALDSLSRRTTLQSTSNKTKQTHLLSNHISYPPDLDLDSSDFIGLFDQPFAGPLPGEDTETVRGYPLLTYKDEFAQAQAMDPDFDWTEEPLRDLEFFEDFFEEPLRDLEFFDLITAEVTTS